MGIKQIGNWFVDFEMQAAYLLVDVDQFECFDYRLQDQASKELKRFVGLPLHVREFLKAKYPNIDSQQ